MRKLFILCDVVPGLTLLSSCGPVSASVSGLKILCVLPAFPYIDTVHALITITKADATKLYLSPCWIAI